jgi:hypothetical protein
MLRNIHDYLVPVRANLSLTRFIGFIHHSEALALARLL